MNVFLKRAYLLSCLFITGCGGGHSHLNYGKTTRSELVAQKGEPIKEVTIPEEEGRVLIYPDNNKFQMKSDIVTHGFKDPVGDEINLIFWKHKFKDCHTTTIKISEPVSHELPEYELKCPSMGFSVIFKEQSEFITRIIEYEKE
jgi:hypothetical protein